MPDGSRIDPAPEPSRGEIAQDLFRDHIDLARLNRTLKGSVNRSNAAIPSVERPVAASQPPRELREGRESVVSTTDGIPVRFEHSERPIQSSPARRSKQAPGAVILSMVLAVVWPSTGEMNRDTLNQAPAIHASVPPMPGEGLATGEPMVPEYALAPRRVRDVLALPPLQATDDVARSSSNSWPTVQMAAAPPLRLDAVSDIVLAETPSIFQMADDALRPAVFKSPVRPDDLTAPEVGQLLRPTVAVAARPVRPRVRPDGGVQQTESLQGARIVLHTPSAAGEVSVLPLVSVLASSGALSPEVRTVDITVDSPTVRYFHASDRARAKAVLDLISSEGVRPRLVDLTSYRPLPRPTTIEIWLPG